MEEKGCMTEVRSMDYVVGRLNIVEDGWKAANARYNMRLITNAEIDTDHELLSSHHKFGPFEYVPERRDHPHMHLYHCLLPGYRPDRLAQDKRRSQPRQHVAHLFERSAT